MEISNYDLVHQVVEMYDEEEILNDFLNEFTEGDNISKDEFVEFFNKYIDDMSDTQFIKENWKWVMNGGEWSEEEDDEEEYDEEYDEDEYD